MEPLPFIRSHTSTGSPAAPTPPGDADRDAAGATPHPPSSARDTLRSTHPDTPRYLEDTPRPEPADVSSDSFNVPNHCIATTRAGASCRSFAIRESAYCIFHDPARAECRRLMQSNGGRAERSRIVAEADRLRVDFYEPGGLQAVIGHVIRLQLLGSLTSRQASQLTKLLALAVNNRRQLSDGEDQASLFDDTTRVLIEATELITDKLHTRDAVERTNAVADFGAKRQEYLKANETFAPRFAPRSPSYPRFR